MSRTWVVVADRGRARILSPSDEETQPLSQIIEFAGRAGYAGPEKTQTKTMSEQADLVHPKGELKAGEVDTDAPGKFREAPSAQHAGEPHTDFKHETAEEFAHELVDYLTQAHREKKFFKLGLVAAPLFLGVLRQKLTPQLAETVSFELDKDYTKLTPAEIRDRLAEHL